MSAHSLNLLLNGGIKMAMDTGYSLADLAAVTGSEKDNDFMGGGGMWIFFLFILLLFTGGGFGGLGGANAATNQINNDFLYTNLNNKLDTGFTQLANSNFSMQKDIFQGFASQAQQMATCCLVS